jgi:Bacterial Ig-like domain (group 3)
MFAVALLGLVGTAGDAFAQTPSSTAVTASPNPGVVGQQVTLTATVTTGAFLAQGQVQFFDGATFLGTGFVGGGLAFFTTSSLALGPHSITAQFIGPDPNNLGSTSPPLSLTINQASTTTTLTSSLNP